MSDTGQVNGNQNTYIEQGDHGDHIDPAILSAGLAGTGEADTEPVNFTSGYVSDGELTVWLEQKSLEQNAALSDAMNLSESRTKLASALTHLKSALDANEHPPQVVEEMDKVFDAAKGTPYEAEIHGMLDGAYDKYKSANPDPDTVVNDDDLKETTKLITDNTQGEIDKLSKVDGLALVQIQQIVADQREASQLASSIISARDQTRSGIIGNIRG